MISNDGGDIITNDNTTSKAGLWVERIHAFQESGLSHKESCEQNEVPQSTLSYWIRNLQPEATEPESTPAPVFAKLPSEQDVRFNVAATGKLPVMICLSENIRIEVAADCPDRLMDTLLQTLKSYA